VEILHTEISSLMKDLRMDNVALSWFDFPKGAVRSIPPPSEVPSTPLERMSI